jgi:hypothetical protein
MSLIGCIAIEVLFNLLPVDHDTLILYWFFPASLLLVSQLYFGLRFTQKFEIKFILIFFVWGCATVILNYRRAQLVDSYEWFAVFVLRISCFSLHMHSKKMMQGAYKYSRIATLILPYIVRSELDWVFVREITINMPSVFEVSILEEDVSH